MRQGAGERSPVRQGAGDRSPVRQGAGDRCPVRQGAGDRSPQSIVPGTERCNFLFCHVGNSPSRDTPLRALHI